MIIWRDGKAGFVGASKRLIKGFFNYSYSVTSSAVIPPQVSGSVGSNRKLTAVSTNRVLGYNGTNRSLLVKGINRKFT